jgi:aminoglycoside 3-N-acetyltransferase
MGPPQGGPFVRDILALGVRAGGVLLVHSSLRALGARAGSPEAVIAGLREALGPSGTLLMPALSYKTVTAAQPVFDVRATPSCVGIIPETFRQTPGVRRSLHPTHSVCAAGPLAAELLGAHLSDSTPCGPCSPFHVLPEVHGQVLMLGCGLEPNTSMHGVEELVVPPYLFGEEVRYTLVRQDGTSMVKRYTTHGFHGWQQRYDRVRDLLSAPDLRVGKVLDAQCYLLESVALWEHALDTLRRDPLAFVERETGGTHS